MEQTSRSERYLIDRRPEGPFVGLRRFTEAANLPHKLKGSVSNFLRCGWRIEVEEDPDVPAHERYVSIVHPDS